ncbi:MAG: hypothetical protein V2I24_13990 [Halieaceae bacterium]|jgi:hypothetical protein|nr:hypothetical protein [Halieaceae bacterium]
MTTVWTCCILLTAAAMGAGALAAPAASGAGARERQSLFDNESLAGWTANIRGYERGDNFADAVRVRSGKLVVPYDGSVMVHAMAPETMNQAFPASIEAQFLSEDTGAP